MFEILTKLVEILIEMFENSTEMFESSTENDRVFDLSIRDLERNGRDPDIV